MAEIADEARQRDIAVAGRGSAAGSLMAHVLGITAVDPVERGLYFERFLNAKRRELPDIDLDVAASRRDELIDWVFTRFGEERVARVSAHQTFRRRGAFRQGLRRSACGPPRWSDFVSGCLRTSSKGSRCCRCRFISSRIAIVPLCR